LLSFELMALLVRQVLFHLSHDPQPQS
jgi:hypothetical protein